MKKTFVSLSGLLLSSMLCAEPVKALLVVQNHSRVQDLAPLVSAGDQFASALGEELFEVINPNDVIGENQNVGPWGEKMPSSSAVRLAESCGADVLLTASITDVSRRDIGMPAIGGCVVITWTVAAKRVPGGGSICSVTLPVEGRKHTAKMLDGNFDRIRDEAVRASIRSVTDAFLSKAKTRRFAPARMERVDVAFVANIPGADVRIDGISVGIAGVDLEKPFKVSVSKGLHNLEIRYPFMIPYKTTARFNGHSTFAVNLSETVAGRALRQGDQKLAAALERILKGGATDDDVRLIQAKGYAKCLEASSFKMDGMPENLTIVKGDADSFGFGLIRHDGAGK